MDGSPKDSKTREITLKGFYHGIEASQFLVEPDSNPK
jgi:hypothetical protein